MGSIDKYVVPQKLLLQRADEMSVEKSGEEFNLIVSTGRGLEPRCSRALLEIFSGFDDSFESWKSVFSGLLLARARNPRPAVGHLVKTLGERPWFNDLVKRAVPVDLVVETNPDEIVEASKRLRDGTDLGAEEPFRVRIRKRGAEVDRMELIGRIADLFANPVDLVSPEFELRVEIIRGVTGVSLIRRGEIFPDL